MLWYFEIRCKPPPGGYDQRIFSDPARKLRLARIKFVQENKNSLTYPIKLKK